MRTDPSLDRNLTSLSTALYKGLLEIYPPFLKPVKIEYWPIFTFFLAKRRTKSQRKGRK